MPESANQPDPAIWRILDANQNRAREALRVIEEFVRFSLNDSHLTQITKQIRHDLQSVLARLPIEKLHAARDTTLDVGTRISTNTEVERSTSQDVLAASFSRLGQSLRALEEYGKVIDPAVGHEIELLRYRTYTLQKSMTMTLAARERLADCRVYVLIHGDTKEAQFISRVKRLISAGVDAIQLRDKQLGDRALIDRARLLVNATRGTKVLAIINDRPDIAVLAQADGVHVGQEELPVGDVRKIVGPTMLIGLSTHSIEQARDGVTVGADYLGVGPVFNSTTKDFDELAGIDLVRQVADEITLPAFAIGGIGTSNMGQIVDAGFRRVAVSQAVEVEDPSSVVKRLKEALSG